MYNCNTTMSSTDVARLTGKVKWFNNKAGYGFITACDGEYEGKDIFAHYSCIRNQNTQYIYLTQGEYVEFTITKSDNDKHEYLAGDVSGIKGGPIMCETRRQNVIVQGGMRKPRPSSPNSPPDQGESQESGPVVDGEFVPVPSKSRGRKPSAKKV